MFMQKQILFQILDQISDAILVINRKQKIVFANQASLETLKYLNMDILGKPLAAILPKPIAETHTAYVERFYQSDQTEIYMDDKLNIFDKRKDGSLFPTMTKISKIKAGDQVFMVVILNDLIQMKQKNQKMLNQMSRLNSIRKVDEAITQGNRLSSIFEVVLNEAIDQLSVDAACILQFNSEKQKLVFAAEKGFKTEALRFTNLDLGEGHAGQAALFRRLIAISDLRTEDRDFLNSPRFRSEGFVTYHAVPLIVKDRILGVLEVFHRKKTNPDADWFTFLDSLADQTAIALDNSQLFFELSQVNKELVNSYDETIKGWSRALDLRDHETEGHTERVTEITLKLARMVGVPESEMVNYRRGAILHDIGKMGVPDRILLKPDKLTEDEKVIMRQHTTFAYDLIYPINYLRPALDIPYCHHEKWDGSGYPCGLKGKEIPLPARIFAIVDVWDALRSVRPYRPSWPKDQVLEYMHSIVGIHFDPSLTPYFFMMIEEDYINP
jgi:PAS domain S-box-containing protein/putative nucleotidyltransferase with HDIG domain